MATLVMLYSITESKIYERKINNSKTEIDKLAIVVEYFNTLLVNWQNEQLENQCVQNIWLTALSQVGQLIKFPFANARDSKDAVSIPRLGRSPGGGNGNPLQYSYLGNTVGRGVWHSTVHGAIKSRMWLNVCTHILWFELN